MATALSTTPRWRTTLAGIGVAAAATGVVVGPAVVSPDTAPQALAVGEIVENSRSSTTSIMVRILEKDGDIINRIVGPNSGVNAGTDDITSYYIPRGTCASINRGGVNIGTFCDGVRKGVASGERIHAYAWRM